MGSLVDRELLEFDNPAFGYDVGKVWAAINFDMNHGAYDVLWREIGHFTTLWKSMQMHFGESAPDPMDLPEEATETYEYLLDTLGSISLRVETDHGIHGWSDDEQDDVALVHDAIYKGFRLGFLLADQDTRASIGVYTQ